MLKLLQLEGRWKRRFPERWSGTSWYILGTLQRTAPPRRRGLSQHARWIGPGPEEWDAKVDGAITCPTDATPADNAADTPAEDDAEETETDRTAGASKT